MVDLRDVARKGEGEASAVAYALDYRRDFVLPIMTIISLAALAISLMLLGLSIRADRQELKTEQGAARIAIQVHLSEMKQYLTDCSAWDVGFTNLVTHLVPEWADQNIGPYLFKTQGFENSFVIGPSGKTTYASAGLTHIHMDAFRYLGSPLSEAVGSILKMKPGSDRRIVGLAAITDGRVAAFAVAPIIPDTKKIAQPSGKLSFLVLVDVLDPPAITRLGLVHQLQDLRLTSPDKQNSLLLRNPAGEVIGGLRWTPRRPGAALRYGGAPIVIAVLILLIMAARRVLDRARNAQAQVQRLAAYDSLTGLRNRASFVLRLDDLVSEGSPFALVSIDLDRFKAVNDQFGHLVGDEVLVQISSRLSEQCSPGDLLARIGGDEFVMLIADGAIVRTPNLALSIIAAMKVPVLTDRVRAHVGASVGVAFYPEDGCSPNEVRQAADLALYRAKEHGRGIACFYSKKMDEAVHDRRSLEISLRDALENDELDLAFQPVLSVLTGNVTSFEALARWTHPTRGSIAPSDFIGLAEECGLIEQLGTRLLCKACGEAARWPEHIKIAVNLSPLQFESGRLCDSVKEILEETGLAPCRLQLEVTESLLIRDVDRTFNQLEQLRVLGIQILMDDFGVGYSSLSYFERFPFDKVKIDRSFIESVPTSPASQAIIKAIVQLGNTLKMDVVAEGVETNEQMEMVSAFGCTHMQGYLLGRPIPKEDIRPFIDAICIRTGYPSAVPIVAAC
ncbi:EAL domain-containing protein [uncultured Sphingomonas sp.]|uniref:bifunctional diguanylate cyclase/phosphodiesterase n=1 Tax=uncultured Sphingomonas sp. TaxID=158754 RepID=UPI0035C9F243